MHERKWAGTQTTLGWLGRASHARWRNDEYLLIAPAEPGNVNRQKM